MSNFLDKIKVKTGLGKMNKFDLSCNHVTTQEFFNLRPIYVRELMPHQSISVRPTSWVRLAPLFKPFFGSVKMINRAFFVPYRTIFEGFDAFLVNGQLNHDGTTYMPTTVPSLALASLVGILEDSDYSSSVSNPSETSEYDFYDPYTTSYYKFKRKGQILMTILNSLGYNINFSSGAISGVTTSVTVSALPLMAFMKIIADWYCNNNYIDRANAINNFISSCWAGGSVNDQELSNILPYISYSLYENDYFTAAFDNPVNPTNGTISDLAVLDVTNDASSSIPSAYVSSLNSPDTSTPSTPSLRGYNASNQKTSYPNNITQFIVDSLKAVTDWVKRYQLVGSQVVDRMLAEFGVQLSAEKLNRSVYLGKTETDVQISDVMSNSDTSAGGVVGDYAAKGVALADNGIFKYKTDEFGVLLILSTIVPKVSYSQGVNRMNLHLDRFDFFRGDFDALGPQAIAQCEVFNDMRSFDQADVMATELWNSNAVFGYTPRYSEYAVANDWLSGCFRLQTQNADLEQWHLFRMFDPSDADSCNMIQHHSEDFTVGDASQYNRIFNYSASDTDHFFVTHHFEVESYMPKKPLFDQYDFDEGRAMLMNLGGKNLN